MADPVHRPPALSSSSFPRRPSLDDFCYDISAMQALARQGSWRSVSKKVLDARKLSLLQFPHEQLVYHAYLILASMKLRNYGVAADEFEALGDLDSPSYRYEHYPSLYPAKSGSMVPFSLRLLHAHLPHRLGQPLLTIERLYSLLHHCHDRIDRLQQLRIPKGPNEVRTTPTYREELGELVRAALHPSPEKSMLTSPPTSEVVGLSVDSTISDNPNSQGMIENITELSAALSLDPPSLPAQTEDVNPNLLEESKSSPVVSPDSDQEFDEFACCAIGSTPGSLLDRWERREELVVNTILSHHLNQKGFVLVLKWLKQMLEKRPHDTFLYSKLAYVQMQLGDLTGAEVTFSKVENIVNHASGDSSSHVRLRGLVSRNRGVRYLVSKQYGAAIKEFDAAIQPDPADVVAANNKALCLMYSKDLIGSTKVLESVLEKQPVVALSESLVLNLCSMYELAFVNNAGIKKSLTDWIMKVAPDDFDLSCTRL